jgi:hypothetical protein
MIRRNFMYSSLACKLGIILFGASLAMVHAGAASAQNSGFLKDYSQLQPRKDTKGAERLVWVSDKFTRQNYQQIMIDPVEFYPKPAPTEQVSAGALKDIHSYIDNGLRKALGATVPIASTTGPGIARMRMALTAASVDKSLKAHELFPVALVFSAAKRGTGTAAYSVKLMVESEIVDSVTGEVLARAVREAKGVEVKGDAPVTLKLAQPQIDIWLTHLREEAVARLGQPAK